MSSRIFNEKKVILQGRIYKHDQGQVLLLVVLLVSVVLTIAMSVLSRSIVNIRLSVEEDQSLKALAAAEAGIEKALSANVNLTGTLNNNAAYSTTQSQLTGNSFLLNNGRLVSKDEGADVWLSEYSDDDNLIYNNPWNGTLFIYWGSNSDNCRNNELVNTMAALEVIVLTGTKTNPSASRYAFDPCAARNNTNKFPAPTINNNGFNIDGKSFRYRAQINVSSQGLFARVVPLYANANVAIQGNPILPVQGTIIRSTGTSGEVQRTVSVLKENPFLPVEFLTYTFLWPN